MGPLKLCYVGWADHVHVERWAGYFAKQGHQVSVISFSEMGRYPPGVKQYRIGLQGRGLRWIILKLRYLLWRIQPDIVHVHWAHFAYPTSLAWPGALAVTVWGSDLYRRDKFSDEEWNHLQLGLQRADFVTCDSRDLAAQIKSKCHVEPDRVSVIQWGVDSTLFAPGIQPALLATELEASDRPVVLSARNFTPVYNQETVVTAFAQVVRRLPTALLVMKRYGGDSEYVAKIRHQIDTLGISSSVKIVDTLPYERMPDLYRLAPVTVSVPLSDGTPMSVLEAMACGSVPIVSDLPSLREWIREGWNGFLVEAQDADQLAARILWLLENRAKAMEFARRNASIVEERASQAANMSQMETLYRAMSARERGAARQPAHEERA